MSHPDPPDDPAAPHPALQPRNYLRPCLLLVIGEEPAYGYELRDRLEPLAPGHWDPGTVYRTLNVMEEDELVHSTWERSMEGPRRRRYEITDKGRGVLDSWARELCGMRDNIVDFLARYEHDHAVLGAGVPSRASPSGG
ncbi:MAG: PadR family transcriptional regulator [Candidatus Dormibacteria bacterium]